MERFSQANDKLDGTGSMVTILTAGASGSGWSGCSLVSITIKGQQNVTDGMIRFFIQNTGSTLTKLFMEVPIIAVKQSATQRSFIQYIYFQTSYSLQSGYKILASTEKAEAFSITIDANNFNYY